MTAISTASFFGHAQGGMAALRKRAEALQAQVSSGERLSRSSDDPVAAARLRALDRAGRLAGADADGAIRAGAALNLADTTLSRIADAMGRARELAVHAANGTLDAGQRAAIGVEIGQLDAQVFALANTRDAEGNALFGGTGSGLAYTRDGAGNAVYAGTASAGVVEIGGGQSVTRSLTGPEFLNFTGPGGATDLMAVLKGLGDALTGGSPDPAGAARGALGALDAGLDKLGTGQTLVGARLAWIELAGDRRADLGELRAQERADVGGADLAETIAALQHTLLALDASQASFARVSGLSLFNHLR